MSYGKVGSMIVDKLKYLLGRKETFANMNAVKIQKVACGFIMRKGMLPDGCAVSIQKVASGFLSRMHYFHHQNNEV